MEDETIIYVVEVYQLSYEARTDPSFGDWLKKFNSLVLEKNEAVETIDTYASYTGKFEIQIWAGMKSFASLDESKEAEKVMFQDPEVMKEFDKFVKYMKAEERRIMTPIE